MNSQAPLPNTLPLADIHLPDAVSAWPPGIGWWLVAIIVIASVVGAYYFIKAYQKKWRYRRQALQLLNNTRQQWKKDQANKDNNTTANTIISLLKRTAMTAYPEHPVSSFHGKLWVEFLNRQTPKPSFTAPLTTVLIQQQYQATTITDADIHQLYKSAQSWIKQHAVIAKGISSTTASIKHHEENHYASPR